jgi:signal recognition particle subunit SEC65
MNKPDEEIGKEVPNPESSRVEQARRVIEEYANSLREIIKALRRKLH